MNLLYIQSFMPHLRSRLQCRSYGNIHHDIIDMSCVNTDPIHPCCWLQLIFCSCFKMLYGLSYESHAPIPSRPVSPVTKPYNNIQPDYANIRNMQCFTTAVQNLIKKSFIRVCFVYISCKHVDLENLLQYTIISVYVKACLCAGMHRVCMKAFMQVHMHGFMDVYIYIYIYSCTNTSVPVASVYVCTVYFLHSVSSVLSLVLIMLVITLCSVVNAIKHFELDHNMIKTMSCQLSPVYYLTTESRTCLAIG